MSRSHVYIIEMKMFVKSKRVNHGQTLMYEIIIKVSRQNVYSSLPYVSRPNVRNYKIPTITIARRTTTTTTTTTIIKL